MLSWASWHFTWGVRAAQSCCVLQHEVREARYKARCDNATLCKNLSTFISQLKIWENQQKKKKKKITEKFNHTKHENNNPNVVLGT